MWPFKKRGFLPTYELDWQFATFEWLLRNFGGYPSIRAQSLILPTSEFFPETDLVGAAKVETIFEQVKQLAGLSEWPTQLEAQEEVPDFVEVQPGVLLAADEQSPGGTFQFPKSEGEPAIISYKPSLVDSPNQLIATFAHELGHYLTATARDEPPGGWDAWEIVVDLTAVFLGFGIFNANSAFQFSQFGDGFTQGWSSQRSGYLSEASLLFALAIFVELSGDEPELAVAHLKPNLKPLFQQAVIELGNHGERINALKAIP